MKKVSKILVMVSLCSGFFMGVHSYAATGDTIGTGGLETGSSNTGTGVYTVTTIVYSGSLLNYLNTQENTISSGLTAAYARLYSLFSKTGLNILKSIDYQSLVCLGAIKSESLLSQLQKDRTSLTISFKKDFIELENQILALEEKKALQESDNVNVFDPETTYESEKARLKDLITTKVKLNASLINNFESGYITKNTQFLSNFFQYSLANTGLINSIKAKIVSVQNVLDAFSGLTMTITKINAKVTGLDDLIYQMQDAQNAGLTNLEKALQGLIDTNIKKYKNLQTLIDELTKQKAYVVGEYQMDFDEYLSNKLQSRYNRSQYLALKTQIEGLKNKFYTNTNQLNCSNILSPINDSPVVLSKINAMSIEVNSGLVKISTEVISSTFKDQLFSGFQALYVQKFKQRYTEYTNYIRNYIATALKSYIASLAPEASTGTAVPQVKKVTYVFTKPYKSNEYNEGIKALQNLLTNLNLYTGAINGIYNAATKNGVYQFQLNNGLLKGYEKKPGTRGWMGPATRAALNKLTK